MAGVYRGQVISQICTNSTSVEGYFKQAWPQIYSIADYDGGIRGFVIELLNYYCTFLWTFMDIFIISISICLATRLKQLNEHLKHHKGMVTQSRQKRQYNITIIADRITWFPFFSFSSLPPLFVSF